MTVKKKSTSSKRAASSKKASKVGSQSKSMSLKEYMEESKKARKRHGNYASYKKWPKEAKSDIQQMVESNDAGTASLTVKDAIAWLEMKYEIQATKSNIMTFLERELNRSTWMR